jgi:hypothetical protein
MNFLGLSVPKVDGQRRRSIERLNADLKQAIGTKVPVRTKAKLKIAATAHMTKLEQSPERVKSFFQDP